MPDAHAGRLFDHVHLRVSDLAASRRFYEAALKSLGLEIRGGEHSFASDELYVSDDGEPTTGMHLAFQAADQDTVHGFYEAALAAGREPSMIRRVLNVGDVSADELAALALEHGFDTFVIGEEKLEQFAADVAPKVRELIAEGRGAR